MKTWTLTTLCVALTTTACLRDYDSFNVETDLANAADDAGPRAVASSTLAPSPSGPQAEAAGDEAEPGGSTHNASSTPPSNVPPEREAGAQPASGSVRDLDAGAASRVNDAGLPSEAQDASRTVDATTDTEPDGPPPDCAECTTSRDACDLSCSRSAEQCVLSCDGNPGECRRDCGDAEQLCALDCLMLCDTCALAQGCSPCPS
jgi:hypothetical protein